MSADDLETEVRQVGFWWAVPRLGRQRFIEVIWPEVLLSLLFGVGGAAVAVLSTDLAERLGTAEDVLPLAAALIAVVFAALAIVVSLPSKSYLRDIYATEGGIRSFLDPFLVAVGVQVAVIVLAIAYRLTADDVAWWIEHTAFYVLGFLLLLGLLDVASLARQLVRHGILRAADATIEDQDESKAGTVQRLPDRR